jgi:hypothetical protein
LKIYLVKRTDHIEWETYDSFIICCENEEEARKTHPNGKQISFENNCENWISSDDIETLEVTYLGKAERSIKKGIILSSFRPA